MNQYNHSEPGKNHEVPPFDTTGRTAAEELQVA
jgi:hypothetical protein